LTAYWAEPAKTINLIMENVENYSRDNSNTNKNTLLRVGGACLTTVIINSLVTGMLDAVRDDEKENLEDFANKILEHWGGNILGEITGMIPLVRDISSIFQGYSIKRMEYAGVEKIIKSFDKLSTYFIETVEGKKHRNKLFPLIREHIEGWCYAFGIPLSNVNKSIDSIMKNSIIMTDYLGVDNDMLKDVYDEIFVRKRK